MPFSDSRIKNILGVSNSKKDLEILDKIEITNYKLIDTIQQGNKAVKKVIAQQIKKVYPQAVTTNLTEVIPNIYKVSSIKEGWIHLVANVKVGNKLKLIFNDGEKLVTVTDVSSNGFKVDTDREGQVFVYGIQVDDFHAVDYEALSMLNISATQELLKRITELEKQNKNLTTENNTLTTQFNELAEDQKQLNERLRLLEKNTLKENL